MFTPLYKQRQTNILCLKTEQPNGA